MKGRKRTPTALHKLKGTPQRHLRGREREPQPRVVRPPIPRGLSAAARAEWKRTIDVAMSLGLVTELDHAIYAEFIKTWDVVGKLERQCAKLGHHCATENGSWKTAPWSTALAQYKSLLKSILVELGMTPASRSRVQVVSPFADEDAGELLAFDGGKR